MDIYPEYMKDMETTVGFLIGLTRTNVAFMGPKKKV
jgi:hypothetical protein